MCFPASHRALSHMKPSASLTSTVLIEGKTLPEGSADLKFCNKNEFEKGNFSEMKWACSSSTISKLWNQRRTLGVVAEPALTMKESRRVMILTPDDDVYFEDASRQRREIEGIRWSENRALPSGIRPEGAHVFRRELGEVQLRRAEEAAEVQAQADFDRRHPGVPHPVSGVWWSLRCAASRTSAGMWSFARGCPWRRRLVRVGDSRRTVVASISSRGWTDIYRVVQHVHDATAN